MEIGNNVLEWKLLRSTETVLGKGRYTMTGLQGFAQGVYIDVVETGTTFSNETCMLVTHSWL